MPENREVIYDDNYGLDIEDQPIAEEFDPDASYNRPAPPIEDGLYDAKVSNFGFTIDGVVRPWRVASWKDGRKPFEVALKAQIIAPDKPLVDGRMVWTDMPFNTLVDPERHTSQVLAAIKAISGKPGAGVSPKGHVEQLVELLKSEPICKIYVQNVLHDRDAEKAAQDAGEKRPKAVKGQRKIMALPGGKDEKGKFTGAADHPITKVRCATKATLLSIRPKETITA